ncbi:hypothetical protein BDV93DRAFT_605100 [Ceratobasidium sp. AG-I]|nr:hypothetical protein BDV93DRAFT_605100 [Ceratobasidium sp. AG-I]
MLIPFAPIVTLCVFLQSLLFQSLDYQVASSAFHLGGYFLLGSNTAYLLTGRMTLLDGLLNVRYIKPPATSYPPSLLLQSHSASPPLSISSRAWADSTPASTPFHPVLASAMTPPTVADVFPALVSHPPDSPLDFDSIQDPELASPSVVEPPSSLSLNTSTSVTSVDILSSLSRLVSGVGLAWSLRSSLSLRSLIGRALDSQCAGTVALVISALFGLLVLGICLHVTGRPLVAQPRPSPVEHIQCDHVEMMRDVRRLLDHLGADKSVSLSEFCHSLELSDTAPNRDEHSLPTSPSVGISSSCVTFAQLPPIRKRAVRKRIPVFTALPTPDPSGADYQCTQSRPEPAVLSTGGSHLSDLFTFDPPAISSPARTISRAAHKGMSTSWSSSWLPRSTAPDTIDRMNENRSWFFDNLFKRLDRLGEDSPEHSTRLSGEAETSVANPVESDKRSIALQPTHTEQVRTPENYTKPLQHKPFMARVTYKLQQWSWIPAWVTCMVVMLMAAGVIPLASPPLLVLG